MRTYLEELRTAVQRWDLAENQEDVLKQLTCFFKETEALSGCKAPRVDAALAQSLSCTRLLQIKKGKPDEKVEDFLQAWFDGLVRHTPDGLPGLVREKADLPQDADLFDLLAAAMLLMLKNADDDWDALYIRPLKERLRERIRTLPSVSLPWKQADVEAIPSDVLADCFYALPEDTPLRHRDYLNRYGLSHQ